MFNLIIFIMIITMLFFLKQKKIKSALQMFLIIIVSYNYVETEEAIYMLFYSTISCMMLTYCLCDMFKKQQIKLQTLKSTDTRILRILNISVIDLWERSIWTSIWVMLYILFIGLIFDIIFTLQFILFYLMIDALNIKDMIFDVLDFVFVFIPQIWFFTLIDLYLVFKIVPPSILRILNNHLFDGLLLQLYPIWRIWL